jgi:hypothetical protein
LVVTIRRLETRGQLNELSFSPDGRFLALAFGYPDPVRAQTDHGGKVRLIDVQRSGARRGRNCRGCGSARRLSSSATATTTGLR